MDDDGFYMGELDGVRGLVPSNFLTEAPDQYGAGGTSQGAVGGPAGVQGSAGTTHSPPYPHHKLTPYPMISPGAGRGNQRGRGHGPGARGPPPPPRDGRNQRGGKGKQSNGFFLVKQSGFVVY